MVLTHLYLEVRTVPYRTPLRSPSTREADGRRSGSTALTTAIVSVGFLSLLHAQLEGEAGEGFLCGVIAKSRPHFFSDPASGFHPCFALRGPLEGVSIFFHHPI